ncbi:MAG: ecotin family protein [Verrucomicrobiales bacterium]
MTPQRSIIVTALALLACLSVPAAAAEHKYLKAFPPAAGGMERYVIELPHKERGEDNNFMVELIVGKEMETDGVNRVHLGGKLETKPLEGWGFTFYEVRRLGPAASTKVGVPPGTKTVKRFVSGPAMKIPYNSRVPIVVYVPKGAEVRYRVWKASDKAEAAAKG